MIEYKKNFIFKLKLHKWHSNMNLVTNYYLSIQQEFITNDLLFISYLFINIVIECALLLLLANACGEVLLEWKNIFTGVICE